MLNTEGELTAAERLLAEQHEPDIKWFKANAYGIERVRLPERLVPKLVSITDGTNVSWKREVLRASAWAMTHRDKKDYGRFYAGWIGRSVDQAKPKRRPIDWDNHI